MLIHLFDYMTTIRNALCIMHRCKVRNKAKHTNMNASAIRHAKSKEGCDDRRENRVRDCPHHNATTNATSNATGEARRPAPPATKKFWKWSRCCRTRWSLKHVKCVWHATERMKYQCTLRFQYEWLTRIATLRLKMSTKTVYCHYSILWYIVVILWFCLDYQARTNSQFLTRIDFFPCCSTTICCLMFLLLWSLWRCWYQSPHTEC